MQPLKYTNRDWRGCFCYENAEATGRRDGEGVVTPSVCWIGLLYITFKSCNSCLDTYIADYTVRLSIFEGGEIDYT